jgi:hypothetical protein
MKKNNNAFKIFSIIIILAMLVGTLVPLFMSLGG